MPSQRQHKEQKAGRAPHPPLLRSFLSSSESKDFKFSKFQIFSTQLCRTAKVVWKMDSRTTIGLRCLAKMALQMTVSVADGASSLFGDTSSKTK